MCAFVAIHMHKTFNMAQMQTVKHNKDRMLKKLFLNGLVLLSFVKLVMNQYPCLHDLSLCAYFVALNTSLVCREINGIVRFIFFCVIGFGVLSSSLMWVAWMQRFSGNANFFWF